MNRVLAADGRILVVAMDHTQFNEGPVPALVSYADTVRACAAGGADAFLSPIGSAARHGDAYGNTALIASVNVQSPAIEVAVERALQVGADAIKCLAFPFVDDDSISRAHYIAAAADKAGLPFMLEPIPGGWSGNQRSPEHIAAGARLAAETGADIIKTFYTGDPESMRTVVEYADAPVVILGGAQKDSLRDLFQTVFDAVVVAGCAGVAIGNNIWRAESPETVTRAIAAIIHEEISVDKALELVEAA
jgi:DhnA family fructose-bisphosphate aldolase class Ia